MKHRIGIVVLAGSLIGGFAALGSYFHELSGAASYDVTGWRGAAQAAGEVSAQAGGRLFNRRAACSACHSFGDQGVGIRGPNLGVRPPEFAAPIATRAALAQEGKTAVEHIVQALYDPDAFVGQGFEAGVMIAVDGPPTMLDDEEIRSIILYLFQQSGVPVTSALEEEIATAQQAYSADVVDGSADVDAPDGSVDPAGGLSGDAEEGRARFEALLCERCHDDEDDEGAADTGRPVAELGLGVDEVGLLLRIARHPTEDAQGQGSTFGVTLTVQDAADLSAFLVQSREHAPAEAAEP